MNRSRISTLLAACALSLGAFTAVAYWKDANAQGRSQAEAEWHDAAVAVASFAILEALSPGTVADHEDRLAIAMSRIPETDAKAAGAAAGRRIAGEVLRAR